jgi:hypothetical protein
MYLKLEGYSSLTKCTGCSNVHINGIGLPYDNEYHNVPEAVFDTAEKASKVFLRVLQKRFSNNELECLAIEWHNELHNEVIG